MRCGTTKDRRGWSWNDGIEIMNGTFRIRLATSDISMYISC